MSFRLLKPGHVYAVEPAGFGYAAMDKSDWKRMRRGLNTALYSWGNRREY